MIGKKVLLDGPTTWVFRNLTLTKDADIITNGYPIVISITGDLKAEDGSSIESGLSASPSPLPPAKAPNGAAGQSFDPGPNSEGYGAPGPSGGAGTPGAAGATGVPGRTPSAITVVVIGKMNGTFRISNRGGNGGPGGVGGDGGPGGSGGQGQRAEPNRLGFGIVVGCKAGPGFGGNGGPGGAAGAGGRGGPAGDGGAISVTLVGDSSTALIIYSSPPGRPGQGGQPGEPGPGGLAGFGGRGAEGCEGRVDERRGQTGGPGQTGPIGDLGAQGTKGKVDYSGSVRVEGP